MKFLDAGATQMKIKSMSDAQLSKWIDRATEEYNLRSAKYKNQENLKKAAEKLLKEHGVSLEEVFGVVSNKRVGSKVAPKWRHKEDKNLTWSGRGREPKWIKKYGVKI